MPQVARKKRPSSRESRQSTSACNTAGRRHTEGVWKRGGGGSITRCKGRQEPLGRRMGEGGGGASQAHGIVVCVSLEKKLKYFSLQHGRQAPHGRRMGEGRGGGPITRKKGRSTFRTMCVIQQCVSYTNYYYPIRHLTNVKRFFQS